MRRLSFGVLFLALASHAPAADHTVSVLVDATPVLELVAPPEATATPVGKTVIHTTNLFLHVWPVTGAKTLDEAQDALDYLIKGDVRKFSASATNAITIAGSPARLLTGSGLEAWDGHDTTVDVVIFGAGAWFFVACVHGEGNASSREREPMLQILRTAKSPQAPHAGK